jgi:pyruvate, orthophosphate dikinase
LTARKASRRSPAARRAPKGGKAKSARSAQRPKAPRAKKRVYSFGGGRADGRGSQKELLGGKGAGLAEMTRLGVPVPPGFTISTEVCVEYDAAGGQIPEAVQREALAALGRVEKAMGMRFGDAERPLLVSVRSGARVSMPGMMDTVLNLGLNDDTVQGLARLADERFALDSYRRFVQMYGDVVLGVPHERFETRLEHLKEQRRLEFDTQLTADDWRELIAEYLQLVAEHSGRPFPQDPAEQLWGAVGAVFRSWGNERAVRYRRIHGIPDTWGTAVNVQAMVFGNMGDDCATGVAFTRNPSTGEKRFYGEYLKNAQGEDVVAGIRTPQPINRASREQGQEHLPTLEEEMPRAYRELVRVYQRLEKHYREMQDIEFTIQQGRLWMLQTRTGKRTVRAGVKIAVDMAREGLISREEAVLRVDPGSLDQLLHPTLDPQAPRTVVAKGLPASPGAAVGNVVFSADEAEARAKAGEKVILVRIETSPEDIHGMHAAQGILTARGGMTSHAAVVARGMGKCCVAGCGSLRIDYNTREMKVDGRSIYAGDPITLDGSTGEVMMGAIPTVTPELGGSFAELMTWADRLRRVRVRTNADTPTDAKIARQFGAEGIGLCRTEHMFFEPGRILAVREMILAEHTPARERALSKLLPMQRSDFVGIFQAMEGLPVTIRLLDPPLHEFVPHGEDEIREVAAALDTDVAAVKGKIDQVREFNPMLGHRGCRLGITFPEIYRMQVRAIVEAACQVAESGTSVEPEIMIPLVSHVGELQRLRPLVEDEIRSVLGEHPRVRVAPKIGTMIEVPRAALTAGAIAEYADFFSFGTNDLTQTTYALSRDDAGKFLSTYIELGILEDDPFVSIDREGIGELMRLGAEKGRAHRRDLKLGICGEHGGDPKSVAFCASLGFDYVSCSPFRVPVARLAAAQAGIRSGARLGRGRRGR